MILPIVDLLLVIVAAALWHYVLSLPPVAPPMAPFPTRPTMLRELETAPRFLAAASACSTISFAVQHKDRVVNGIYFPEG
jgi:hypothetical protein